MPTLKPYPAYKPAAVSWLQQVPEHWEVSPGLSHLRFKQEKNTGMVEKQVLSLSYGRIVIKPKEKLTGLVPESFETYQIVGPGDIIVRATDLQNDRTSLRIGEVKDRGIITSAYLCLNVHNGMVPSFGYYLIHAYDLMKVLYGFGSGLRQNLDWKDFKRMPLAVPPPDEQHLIVRYLHALDAKVKRYIRTKRTLIARLQEQKQAIIQRAVTRGLDPNVKLKPSGVEWLGEVPEHWEVLRLGAVLAERGEMNKEGGIAYVLSLLREKGVIPYDEKGRVGNKKSDDITRYKIVRPDDIVMNSMNVIIGSVGLSKYTGCLSPVYYVLKARVGQSIDYFNQVFQLSRFQRGLVGLGNGILEHRMRISMEKLKCVMLPVPPLDEQLIIVREVEGMLQPIEKSIQAVSKELEVMQEYQTRLIADVVTGAVDVRAAAKALPEVDQIMGRSEVQTIEAVDETLDEETIEQ
jgi:type I restriction enzyme S subunit